MVLKRRPNMDSIIDRTPCNICTHEEVCSHKIIHAVNVKEIAAYVDANSSLDLIYVSCTKFVKKPVTTLR
jgi:hypothetical protein